MHKTLYAVSMTSTARAWLADSQHVRILHVFDEVCNLINERRDVISIVTPRIGMGPFNLLVENHIAFTEHIDHRCPVSVFQDRLMYGGIAIDISKATLWNSRPDWERLHSNKPHILHHLFKTLLATHVQACSIAPDLQSLISDLSSALATADTYRAKKITSRLAGLGPGLTPAGDDIIMGALYASWTLHPHEKACAVAAELANTAAPLTTSLSAAWLRAAGRGEAGIVWHEFLNALAEGNPAHIRSNVDKILAIGASSGADALSGFLNTILFDEVHAQHA